MSVIVIGDLVADVVVAPAGPVAVDSDTPASVLVRGGGSGANAAAWLARTGAEPVLVARVGDDLAGQLLREELQAAGVETLLTLDPRSHTGAIVVLIEPDGRRTMLTDRGASALLSPGDIPATWFATAGHVHLSGYTLLGESSRPAGLAALRLARESGVSTSVTPGTAAPLRAAGAAAFLEWTAGATLCLANREEAAVLLGLDAAAEGTADSADDGVALARGLAAHYPEAVVTLGAHGAVWAGPDETVALPAVAGPVADTTGAGDALAAGLLAAWLAGASRAEALGAGLALAAEAVAAPGGRPAVG